VAGDSVWVVDRSGRVQGFGRDGSFRRAITVGEGERGFPIGVLADASGGVLVCDTHQNRLRAFDREGVEIWGTGGKDAAPDPLQCPQRVARDSEGRLYVTEYGEGAANRVRVFSSTGQPIRSFGGPRGEDGGLTRAMGIAIVGDLIFVTDISDRIVVYRRDGSFLRSFGSTGKAPGELRYPYGICAIGATLYVCEYGNHRVQRFTLDGSSRGCFGRRGHGAGDLQGPWDVAADAAGRLYVCDTGNHRIVVLDPESLSWSAE
jgi:DNA-binding beta-propeller fold protein YncE